MGYSYPTADHPIDRAAGQDRFGSARPVAGINPVAAAFDQPRRPHRSQFVEIGDADSHLEQMQRPRCRNIGGLDRSNNLLHQTRSFEALLASAISSTPSSTRSPTAYRTVSTIPSRGAAIVCSIFIASTTISA